MNEQLLAQHKQSWFDAIDKHNNDKHPERVKKQKKLDMETENRQMREAEQFLTDRALLNQRQTVMASMPSGSQKTEAKPLTKEQMIMKLRGGLPNERQTLEERYNHGPSRTRAPIQKVY